MTFEEIYNSALDIINKLASCGEVFGPGSAVCVINTRSGRIFYGRDRDVHAEMVAFREMQGMGEFAIDTLILVDPVTRTVLTPCANCAGYLLSAAPDNAAAFVAMPDRMVRLTELTGQPAASASAAAKNAAKGSLLKDRVSDIMNVMDDDDDDDDILEEIEEEAKPKKKKLFGLF
ncbi:MAG: hypothetical protein K6G68_08415 [Oscillospiraceae bacterium]|nr:hypothetical protein [Oscillospiraceae bacterium]